MNSKALIIDDDPSSRRIVSYLFEKKKIEVVEAVNGEQGLTFILNDEPLIVVLDWKMPILGGHDMLILSDGILSEITKINKTRKNKVNVVFYSSVRFDELSIPKTKNYDFLGYVNKNWSLDLQTKKFNEIIRTLLEYGEAA